MCPPASLPIAQGLPGRIRSTVERVVRAFAIGVADRINRREVHNIEAEVAQLGQAALGVPKGAGLPALATLRSHEHLVPGSEASFLAIDNQLQQRLKSRRTKTLTDAKCGRGNLRSADRRENGRSILRLSQLCERALEQLAIAAPSRSRHSFQKRCSLEQIGRNRP